LRLGLIEVELWVLNQLLTAPQGPFLSKKLWLSKGTWGGLHWTELSRNETGGLHEACLLFLFICVFGFEK